MVTDEDLPISSLLLDVKNPRHREVASQEEAIRALLGHQPIKLYNLAVHIIENGLSPIDGLVVLRQGTEYTVLEGNRRVAALKLLLKPAICPLPRYRNLFTELAKRASLPTVLRVKVVDSREEAMPWLEVRHGGELDGAGTVRWSTGQRTRAFAAAGTQEYKALAVLDWVFEKAEAGANETLFQLAENIFDSKITTFGRLVGDPEFRAYCGFDLVGHDMHLTQSDSAVLVRLNQVLLDLAGDLTVSALKLKDQRKEYVRTLAERLGESVDSPSTDDTAASEDPKSSTDRSDEEAAKEGSTAGDSAGAGSGSNEADSAGGGKAGDGSDDDGGATATAEGDEETSPKQKPDSKRTERERARSKKLFYALRLRNCGPRTRDILREAQKLDADTFRNSAAALTRMVIEFVVSQAIVDCGWTPPPRDELRQKVQTCITYLDPSGKDKRYKDIRNQVGAPDSIIGGSTLNAFLHNPNYFPTAVELRSIADKYVDFLKELDSAIGQAKT
ncbi:hypothetical protein ACBJ59_35960 [Nonomuraea sp. MTCD27]|uniref:hypothetical protein n=1 Tax=Nonomuraea sp. MTCD27 TaxID=1676747 RepID=UPI0035BF7CF9